MFLHLNKKQSGITRGIGRKQEEMPAGAVGQGSQGRLTWRTALF